MEQTFGAVFGVAFLLKKSPFHEYVVTFHACFCAYVVTGYPIYMHSAHLTCVHVVFRSTECDAVFISVCHWMCIVCMSVIRALGDRLALIRRLPVTVKLLGAVVCLVEAALSARRRGALLLGRSVFRSCVPIPPLQPISPFWWLRCIVPRLRYATWYV